VDLEVPFMVITSGLPERALGPGEGRTFWENYFSVRSFGFGALWSFRKKSQSFVLTVLELSSLKRVSLSHFF